jgi:hypothetical protein
MIIPANWNLPGAIKRRVSPTTYGRQRAIIEEEQLLLVLHKPPGPDDSAREGVLFWRDLKKEWHTSRGGAGAGALKKLIQDYAQLEGKLTDVYEAAHDAKTLFDVLDQLIPLGRAARNMHLALQAARDGMEDDPFLIEVRDACYDVERNIELLLEDVRNAIQYRTLKEAEEQACLTRETLRASHRLNILIALFLPLTAIGSIFGMNLASGLDNTPNLFWLTLTLGLTLGGALVTWVLAKPK